MDRARQWVHAALEEDLQWGPDVTTLATIPADQMGTAAVVARAPGCIAASRVAATVFDDSPVEVQFHLADGDRVAPGDTVLTATGPIHELLTRERTLLNVMCQLSGVATLTRQWMDALDGTGAVVRDTRKTIPGERILQKYAVECGGGMNHRMGLGDAALIKDNHVAAIGSVAAAYEAVKSRYPDIPVEVEVDTIEQVREAVGVGVDLILLDNMSPQTIRQALEITTPAGVKTEASGGITLERAHEFGETGVDYIAVGELTHSAKVLDLGFDLSWHS